MIKVLNLPRELCHHTLGKHHTPAHRMTAGAVIAIHGLGAVPYIEWLLEENHP